MAVQAQFPSNVLLLKRNKQEGFGMDCSLQPQPGGGVFLDHQSRMVSSRGAAMNTRKRRRDASVVVGNGGHNIASSGNVIANSFNLQQQPQPQPQALQYIDLSQLHHNPRPHQSTVIPTGLELSFNDQRHHRQGLPCELVNSVSPLLLSDDFAARIRPQQDEIDQLLVAQGEHLRRALAEKWRRHYRALLGAAEEVVAQRMRKKEAEVEKAKRRNAELEARAAQLTMEVQVWQAKARAQETAAVSLQAQLQQAVICGGHDRTSPEDGSGGGCGLDTEDAESAYIDPDRVVVASGPSCRACRRRVAAVLLLPCRHLSVCTECSRVARDCPLCFTARESSIEVYLP